ncbi:MAG: aminopeptidase P family protein [Oscillospiraceae bacterium]|nr:aminopeptidase P family protein [Oscillospiraceae bacterium]
MNNIAAIKRSVANEEFDALLILSPENRLFATGFETSDGALLVTSSEAWFYTDMRYIEAATAAISDAYVKLVTNDSTYTKQIASIIAEKHINSIGFEDSSLSYTKYHEWDEKLSSELREIEPGRSPSTRIELMPAQKLLNDLRMIKSSDALEIMIEAQRISEKSFNEILPLISTDMTEKDLAAELIYRLLKNGADDKSFDPIIVSGPKSSMPHGVPGNVKIGKGFLTIDFGARYDGWCSDTTRTLCIGAPDEEMAKVYDTVLKAQEAGINAARAGIAASQVDAAARDVIKDAGYGEYFGHGFGHGVGIQVHEAPTASPISKDVLQAGAIISAEPGIYLPGRYGVRIEDVIYITENGCENITKLPKNLIVL